MAHNRIAIHPDGVFTGLSDTLQPSVVIVDDDRIVGIETSVPPEIDRVVRLPGITLLPGLIDAHTHVSILPCRGNQIDQMRVPLAEQMSIARSNVLADLLSGVTTMRVMGQEFGVDFAVKAEIAAGDTLGPDLICAGVQLAKENGHGHALTFVRDTTRHPRPRRRERSTRRRADQDLHDRRRLERRDVARPTVHSRRRRSARPPMLRTVTG